jgi:hypothetical protein
MSRSGGAAASMAGSAETRRRDVHNSGRGCDRWRFRGRRTALSCHAACSRGCAARPALARAARTAGYGRAPASGSSRRGTAPRHKHRDRQCRALCRCIRSSATDDYARWKGVVGSRENQWTSTKNIAENNRPNSTKVGCPVGGPSTLALSRLRREGIPALCRRPMAIRAGAEGPLQTGAGT